MHFTSALVLAAAAGQAAAGSISHRHAPGKVHNHALRHAEILKDEHLGKRGLQAGAASFIQSLGAKIGVNADSPTSNVWIGTDGPYTNEFTNESGEDLVLAVWGPAGSWINAVQPLITHSMAAGENLTLSFAEGASGAFSAIYPTTKMVNGQVFETWGEFTFAGDYSTYDVSREVNMQGRAMAIQGPGCLSNMDQCSFVCEEPNAVSCWFGYKMSPCDASHGGGSGTDPITGDPSGGCNGISGGSAKLYTSLQ